MSKIALGCGDSVALGVYWGTISPGVAGLPAGCVCDDGALSGV